VSVSVLEQKESIYSKKINAASMEFTCSIDIMRLVVGTELFCADMVF
jgi:hypothetical protein